jgi:2-polyprenyl-3-methyl-5-hydroxy-6-metoxy-1,4-benzoquinol methylase
MSNPILTTQLTHSGTVGSTNKGANDTNPVKVEPLPDLHDRITEAYFGKMGKAFARSTRERVHWICSVVEGTRVLNVGCSQGIISIILGREQKFVTGIDIAKRSIDKYLSMESCYAQDNVTFIHGDFRTADLGQDKFDTIILETAVDRLLSSPNRHEH